MKNTSWWVGAILLTGSCVRLPPASQGGPASALVEPGEHFLFTPRGDPEALLGRRLIQNKDGLWTLAEAREPGCVVEPPQRKLAAWTKTLEASAGRVVVAGAQIPSLLSVKGEHTASTSVRYTISNQYMLLGNVRNCGDNAIIEVNVGTGSRGAAERVHNELGASSTAIEAQARGEQHRDSNETIHWDTPQAWGVIPSQQASQHSTFDVALEAPAMENGDTLHIAVHSDRKSWLVAYCVEVDGRVGIWFPNHRDRLEVVEAKQWKSLPGVKMFLRDPSVETVDTLVVYGFFDERDYEEVRPVDGVHSEAGALDYTRRLEAYVRSIPADRYNVRRLQYRITPKLDDLPTAP